MRPTIENAKKQQEYIDSLQQQFGTLEPVDKSLREKSVDVATDVIGALPFGGGGDYYDRKIAKSLLGDYYEENIADSIGVADFTPLGLIYGVDEALREYGEAEKATDYILPTVGLGLSALEAFPLTEVGTRPLRKFLSNLGNKTSSESTDMSRRTLLKGAVAAPVVAGALSEIPLGKVVDDPSKNLIKNIKLDFPNDIDKLNPFALKKYFDNDEKLFEWFDSGITDNLMLPDSNEILKDVGGDFKKANDIILNDIDNLIDQIHYDKRIDESGTQFFQENVTDMLIEDLTKASK